MQISTLVNVLDQPHVAAEHLAGWGLSDVERGRLALLDLADLGLTLDLLTGVSRQLASHLPACFDPDAALTGFGRFMAALRSPLSFAALLERDPSTMPALLAALSLGPQWTQWLIADPESFDLLRDQATHAPQPESILNDVLAEISTLDEDRAIVAALTRLCHRHLLRVAYGEAVGELSLSLAQEQLTALGEALLSAALAAALQKARLARPLPAAVQQTIQVCILGLGDLGARQLALRWSFDLLMLYDLPATDAAALQAAHDQMERTAKVLARWLTEAIGDRANRTVHWAPLPDSPVIALAHAAEDVVVGFDSFGRTWHRQQMLQARPVAGDRDFGRRVLARLEGWLYRRYLNRADETGIKALKRRILVDATLRQDDWRQPRRARGGIRDIEATVLWLQLLVGGDQPSVRTAGTLAALKELAAAGTLAPEEEAELASNYSHFQQLEHLLEIYTEPGDELPEDNRLLERLARSLGGPSDAEAFTQDLRQRQERSWQIVRKLLTSAFTDEAPPAREVELLLDPSPPLHEVRAALAPFGFVQPEAALAALNDLASEQVPFLSTRRCRHLLATILPRLLTAISSTPGPDGALSNLARVSNSLGGKGVLWDLFRFSPPTLDLYVKLCAASPYLSGILTNNPGMIDELVDSLQLDRLPSRDELEATLEELCRGVADTLPVLHDFKNAGHLRIGVRDLLGKDDIDRTHAALADVAEACLGHVIERELARLVEKYGAPTIGLGPFEGEACRLVVLGLGKLGGREPNYHSPLDLLVLYEAEGTTRPARPTRRVERTANNHFFTQLAQRITKQLSELTPKGRLYAVEMPLRPVGLGGAMAMTLDELGRHFREGAAPLWHWQALSQARPVYGEPPAQQAATHLVEQLIRERAWRQTDFDEMRRWRLELQRGASDENLKRAPGGTLDVEFLVQVLQIRHASAHPSVLVQNTQDALGALAAAGALNSAQAEQLGDGYRFLRRVESGLRLLNTSARHDLPSDRQELAQLAFLLGHSNPERLREQCREAMAANRALFERLTTAS